MFSLAVSHVSTGGGGGQWERLCGTNEFDSLLSSLIYQPVYPADVMFWPVSCSPSSVMLLC